MYFICTNLSKRLLIVYFSDKSITHRNQDNGFLDRIGEIKSRDNDQDGVPPGMLAISFDIDAREISS